MTEARSNNIKWLPMAILGCFLVMNLIFGVFYITSGEKFPIEVIRREIISSSEITRESGERIPVIHVTSGVAWPTARLIAETCSTAEVTVDAELSWTNTDPTGFTESRGNFISQLSSGCVQSELELQILEESRTRIREQAEIGNRQTTWQVTGVVAALNADGTTGKFITWTSNEFVVSYDL